MKMSLKRLATVAILIATVLLFWITLRDWSDHTRERDSIVLYGNVDIRQMELSFRVFGKIQELFVDEGDQIEVGQVVARLDPLPYLEAKKAAEGKVESSEADLKNSASFLQRREGIASSGAISEESYDDLRYRYQSLEGTLKEKRASLNLALQNLQDCDLLSLQRGTILSRVREAGSVVQPGETIFTLSLASPLWIRAYVAEPLLGRIYPGMKAEIYTDTSTNPVYHGHVGFISPVAEFTPKNIETTELRTDLVYRLRIIVDDVDGGLRQGMPVTVRLKTHLTQKE